jgi:hypothetical protein
MVNLIAWVGGQPALDAGMLMSSVVVYHQMDPQIGWHTGIHLFEKLEILLMAVAVLTTGKYLTRCNVQRSKKSSGAVTDVVVSHAFDVSQPHRQQRLSAIKGLYLAFLVDTQHHGLIRRTQVEPHDIPHLLYEEWVCGELEMALTMRLQAKCSPNPMDGGA